MKRCLDDLKDLTGDGIGRIKNMRPFEYLLAGLTIASEAKVVLEIGTGAMCSAVAFLLGLEVTKGKLYSCDLVKRFEDFNHPRFVFLNKSSDEVAKGWKEPIDILFIDGDHGYNQVNLDYRNFFPFVVGNGLVIFHDTIVEEYEGPRKVVRGIKGFPKIVLCAWPGLTIFQKT